MCAHISMHMLVGGWECVPPENICELDAEGSFLRPFLAHCCVIKNQELMNCDM